MAELKKNSFAKSPFWGTVACGAGLLSDGYLNGIIGPVGLVLKRLYPTEMTTNAAQKNVYSIAFAGTIIGQLFFGWTSDHISRKWSLTVSTIILIIFAFLSAGSYASGSIQGMLTALTIYRFFVGIGIGGEYPAGSVGAAEHTGSIESKRRNGIFILFTNMQIDLGFVFAPLTAMIVVVACTEHHLRAAWRILLGVGGVLPIFLLLFRFKISDSETFAKEKMTVRQTPWLLIFRFYGFRLATVAAIWFIYDFSAYAFILWSGPIVDRLVLQGSPSGIDTLWRTFGWNTLLNFFNLPGCLAGVFLADSRIAPKWTLIGGLLVQTVVGFIIALKYEYLADPSRIGAFIVLYGLFLALGEVGVGNNISLFAAKTSSTNIRGKYYGVAAATGKLGAFVGNQLFPEIAKLAPRPELQTQYQFYVGGGLSLLAAVIALGLPQLEHDVVANEDLRFRAYLEQQGYDTSVLGLNGESEHISTKPKS